VRDPKRVHAALDGRTFDVVVANAGLGRGLGSLQAGEAADWDRCSTRTSRPAAYAARDLPAMIARERATW
jgi:NADP-dependent 3-hydroxy acid dehydrogenase YdfG